MNFNNLISAFLLFCVGIKALKFPGSIDGRIRRCLIAGLKRFHSNSAPLMRNIPILYDSEDSNMLSNYPVELKQVFFGNLDFKSIKKLSQCNKQAALLSASTIAQRLASFNPHFAFDDELVDSLLLAVLDKHFPKSKNLQSETIHDELQLLIMKYTRDDLNFDSIPKNIYFYLISFMNEAVNGVDAIFDTSIQYFCVLLLKFKIPKSYNYFSQFFGLSIFKPRSILIWKNHLKFFSQNPSKEELRRHFEIPADINDWVESSRSYYGFYDIVLELFYDEFTDENVVKLYQFQHSFYTRNRGSLKSFTRRYFSIIDENELMRAYKYDIFYSNANRAIICNELSVRFGITIDMCYFSTRNSLNELSLDRLAFFDSETIFKQLTRYPKIRIYDLEFIVTVMNSDLIGPKLRFKVLIYFVNMCISNRVVELLVKETIQPLNFIEFENESLTNFICQVPKNIFLEFVDSVNDPLICIMILDSKFSLEAKRTIQQKDLDLNRIYRFKIRLSKFGQFVGRTMHFKQIIKELNEPKLYEAFNFDSTDLNHDYTTIDESLPVVIVDKDYTFKLNSY
jgi:hypothetical protein